MNSDTSYQSITETGQSDHNPLPNEESKMTPKRILEIYEDVLDRYKQYVADEEVDIPYEELDGVIQVHLPPIHGKADDREKFKGCFEPEDAYEVTVVATMDSASWFFPVHILDIATEEGVRDCVSQMLFSCGNEAWDFTRSQEF
jgi:hypothetical protein